MRSGMVLAGILCTWVALPGAAFAQEAPVNATMVGRWTGYGGDYADVWGTPGVAYVAHYGDAGVHILDISNPQNPTELAHYRVPANSNDASAQDVKVHDGLMFVGLESESSNSVDVVDVRDPANPQHLTWLRIGGELAVHNVFYDNGWVYLADSGTPVVAIVDMTAYDPDNPPAVISTAAYTLNNVGSSFVHDMTVQDGRLYACAWDSGLWVYDVSNLAAQAPSFLGSTPGNNTHSCWVTADNKFVVTGEERTGGGIQVFEITDNGGSVTLTLRDQITFSTSRAISVHNQTIVGHRLYNAWYQTGLQVYDIDPVNGQLTFVASYDTTPASGSAGFDGAWGVYPFNGENEVLMTDLATGFWIIDVGQSVPLTISFPNGTPVVTPAGQDAAFLVQIDDGDETVVPGSESLFWRAADADPWTETALSPLGGGLYTATIPGQPCLDGEHVSFYVAADGDLGSTVFAPDNAPAVHFDMQVGELQVVMQDDFETDMGWTVNNIGITGGAWERGVPTGDGTRGDPLTDFDGSGSAYLTGNGAGDTDVDGGPTQLFSPVIDPGGDATFSYARWMSNDDADSDALLVEISNDAGANWTAVETIAGVTTGWVQVSFNISDFVTPTALMQWRFSVADEPNDSVTEAAIDAFDVSRLTCETGGKPVEAPLVAIGLPVGTQTGGGLAELEDSDDAYATFEPEIVAPNKHVVDMVVHADSPFTTVSRLDVTVETSTNRTKVVTKIYLNDRDASTWVQLDKFLQPRADTVSSFPDVPNPNAYVRDSDGRIRVRLFARRGAVNPFVYEVDHVELMVTP